MEKTTIDVEHIFAAFHPVQERVDHVIVEGTGGWLVAIRSDYFVSDLAAAMKLPVLVVAQNRLGCSGLANADILKRILDVPLLA
jgi:dethiobiotin synthetase